MLKNDLEIILKIKYIMLARILVILLLQINTKMKIGKVSVLNNIKN